MKTFKEYVNEKELTEADTSPAIVKAGNKLAAQNPRIIPGMTDLKNVKIAMRQPVVKSLAAKGEDPGAIGSYLAGPQVAKQAGIATTNDIQS